MKARIYRSLAITLSVAALWVMGVTSMKAAQSDQQFPGNDNTNQNQEQKKGGCCSM
ncbi:MAG: hypothetical protein NTY77_18375 [Elusimicrobia bacterium]|nr:hypothetical protein [Elusimicrobiota bacterium]